MINAATIKSFLDRKLESYDWLKGCDQTQLDQELATLTPQPEFGSIMPWLHQKIALLLLLELKHFLLFLDLGAGKTLISLMLLLYRKQRGEHPKAIVFVPYLTSVETWVEQVAEHAPQLKCMPLLGTTAENAKALKADADLFVICYQSAVAMVTEPVRNNKGKIEWQLRADNLRDYFAGFDTLIGDELHKAKSHKSLIFKMCRAISSQCEYTLGLTGTPFGKDLQDLWPQFYLIDFGETLGTTLGIFREAYFKTKINYWGGYEYTFKKKLLPTLQQTIKNRSISYTIEELQQMVPKRYIIKHLPQPHDAKGYCERALDDLRDSIKNKQYKQVESHYLQLRQLASGFMTLKGEDSEKLHVQFDENPKLEMLEELLDSMPATSKIVIFHTFVYTNGLISERLTKLKIKHARIWGGQKDPIGELRRFKQEPDCTALVINTKSGSSSLNLQFANYLCFFEQPDSPIDRKQAEARIWRPGQKQGVYIYDFLCHHTVDQRLYGANKNGVDLLKELLSGGQI